MTMHYTKKEQCACCSYYTLDCDFDICPVCFWQHDVLQEEGPDLYSGANSMTLNEAKKNYQALGACAEYLKIFTRPPLAEERQRPE